MSHAIFELDTIRDLPLWAQVLIASRLCRRAVLWLATDTPTCTRDCLLAGCDAIDRCVQLGQRPEAELEVIKRAVDHEPPRGAECASTAIYYGADAAFAAESSLDFEAAESACTGSVRNTIAAVAGQDTLTPMQVHIFAAADLDLLRFACKESGVGRYDGLSSAVLGRLTPIHAPDPKDIRARPSNDPRDDFR